MISYLTVAPHPCLYFGTMYSLLTEIYVVHDDPALFGTSHGGNCLGKTLRRVQHSTRQETTVSGYFLRVDAAFKVEIFALWDLKLAWIQDSECALRQHFYAQFSTVPRRRLGVGNEGEGANFEGHDCFGRVDIRTGWREIDMSKLKNGRYAHGCASTLVASVVHVWRRSHYV